MMFKLTSLLGLGVYEQIRLHFQTQTVQKFSTQIPSEVEDRQRPPWVQDELEILDFFLAWEETLGNWV